MEMNFVILYNNNVAIPAADYYSNSSLSSRPGSASDREVTVHLPEGYEAFTGDFGTCLFDADDRCYSDFVAQGFCICSASGSRTVFLKIKE